jgi:hypothetical protein
MHLLRIIGEQMLFERGELVLMMIDLDLPCCVSFFLVWIGLKVADIGSVIVNFALRFAH